MNQLQSLLVEFQDIFSQSDFDIGQTSTFRHNIKLTDDLPLKQRHRRIPPGMMQEVRDHLAELLNPFKPEFTIVIFIHYKPQFTCSG